MSHLLFVDKVGDYNKFESIFNANDSIRKQNGCISAKAYRSFESPEEVVVITEWQTREQAVKWSESQVLKDSLKQAGAGEKYKVYYLD